MTTNIERAIDAMSDANDGFTEGDVHRMAQALADAKVLMPDLPTPEMDDDRLVWRVDEDGFVYIKPDGRIATIGVSNPYDSPSIAYRHALAILAAADYAEQEQGNG